MMDKLLTSKNLFLSLKILILILLVIFMLSFSKVIILGVGILSGYYLATIVKKFKDAHAPIYVKATKWWSTLKTKFK